MSRFAGALGKEYALFAKAVPHYHFIEEMIGYTAAWEEQARGKLRLLEIGTGLGATTLPILAHTKCSTITTVDCEPVMLEQARKNLETYCARVSVFHADGLEFLTQTESGSFDAFCSGYTLHNFHRDYRKQFLKELGRVLAPEAIFVNADKYAFDSQQLQNFMLKDQISNFRRVFGAIGRNDLAEAWIKHYYEDERDEVVMREEEARRQMKDLGFCVAVPLRIRMEAVMVGLRNSRHGFNEMYFRPPPSFFSLSPSSA